MDLVERTGTTERRHPWEVARAGFFLSLLERHGALRSSSQWLDVGAGDGWLGSELRTRLPDGSRVVCWDINYTSDDLASNRPGPGVELTDRRPDGQFDGALLLDVIEHVEADAEFLRDAVELVTPGGWVLVSVPAHPRLFSAHDTALRHHRRYVPRVCARLLEQAGLEIVVSGGLFHALVAVRAAQVARERVTGPERGDGPERSTEPTGVGHWRHGRMVTAALTWVLSTEAALSLTLARRGWGPPGLSWWALGKRRR
jgi:SAM-dependent methyltransferase